MARSHPLPAPTRLIRTLVTQPAALPRAVSPSQLARSELSCAGSGSARQTIEERGNSRSIRITRRSVPALRTMFALARARGLSSVIFYGVDAVPGPPGHVNDLNLVGAYVVAGSPVRTGEALNPRTMR
jgi:hypothetical protein